MASLEDKIGFLNEVTSTCQFKRREVYWVLNYLETHPTILEKVRFVEQADKTTRGLKIMSEEYEAEPMTLFLFDMTFIDPEQIFHEMRKNWKKELYIEIVWPKLTELEHYLAVLEDNPFTPWNDSVTEQDESEVEEALNAVFEDYTKERLLLDIDEALEANDSERFKELSEQLKRITD